MLLRYDRIIGAIFLLVGILGFIPALTPNGMLLGIFMIDPMHNVVHLLSGLVLLGAGLSNNWAMARSVTLLFATVYGIVTIVGFLRPDGAPVLGMPMNMADDVLHLAITVSALMFALPQRYPSLR